MRHDRDEFYVGYRAMPVGLKRFIHTAVIVIVASIGGVAWLVAARQRDPGDGTWDLEKMSTIEGAFIAAPYPAIETPGGVVLLVGEGKAAASGIGPELQRHRVRATGYLIRRGDLSLLELVAGIEAIGDRRESTPTALTPATAIRLVGEIIDPKCFAGAMKPGDGKPHKACATLCLRGGIPPAFVTRDDHGNVRETYLLVDEGGGPLAGDALEALIPFVADRIEVEATPHDAGGRTGLVLNLSTIKRL